MPHVDVAGMVERTRDRATESATSLPEEKEPSQDKIPPAEIEIQRVDDPHPVDANQDSTSAESTTETTAEPTDWLHYHCEDLVPKLQQWSSELDSREAQLNARVAVQESSERQFRMSQADEAASLSERRRAVERVEAEVKRRARQLAFALQAF